ncbi:MAG: nucleotide sugar dehydrogenase, partial [Proteobacteria bacterium]|nr:nucleotide sugar dehydrogenase [Pseudomonadota bacterium]
MDLENLKIGVIGLGYVGLPLVVELDRHFHTVGFDVKKERIAELKTGHDSTLEVDDADLKNAGELSFTTDPKDLADCNFFIVTVPTPIDKHKRPDLQPLISASETIGEVMQRGSVVVFESTVYPGATEEVCVPQLEKSSGLKFNQDFFVGYSPERINPGDKTHRLPDITKITSGSTPEVADFVDSVYRTIITVGTHKASSIRVAEAAKVIENTQRDLNIALMNELALIFDRMNIDTRDVLAAASSKWNFLPFTPGLVRGHCIGVDPYYLTHKATTLDYYPQVILAGRRINDGMGAFIAAQVIKSLIRQGGTVKDSVVTVLGLAFKENVPDLRNTRVIDIVRELTDFGLKVQVSDPLADSEEAKR